MSLADAITAATGLIHGRGFEVRDIGAGPFLVWQTKDVPQPDDKQLAQWVADFEATVPDRAKLAELRSRAIDYVIGIMAAQELGDDTKLNEVKADIATAVASLATVDVVQPTPLVRP